MRTLIVSASAAILMACSLAPQLSPRAAGCYAVHVDSVPAVLSRLLVPEPPQLVRLNTLNGGQLEVPTAWLQRQGLNMRSASLDLMRPGWRMHNGTVHVERVAPSLLPPDTLVLTFANGPNVFAAQFGADAVGNWSGWAFALVSGAPVDGSLMPARLVRHDCGTEPLGISR